MAEQAWNGQTGGTPWMQRTLVGLIRCVGIQAVYGIMHLWLVWYVFARPDVTRGAYIFHRRRGRNRFLAAIDVYRSYYHFGKVIIDRFAVYSGYRFDIVAEHTERYYDKMNSHAGFILLFSHLGNSEMAAYSMATPGKRMNILAFGGETPVVMEERAKVLEKNNIGMIVVNPGDISHIFEINESLNRGEVLAVAGDRRMGDKTIDCTFMGGTAPLPAGVFQLCAAIRCPILLTFVLKEPKNKYHIYMEELHINTTLPRAKQAADLAQQYASRLEQMALEHPYEWFNFFDFWNQPHKAVK